MTELFNGKYRVSSARAKWWDYEWNASYFVTICTHFHECFFGEVQDGAMNLSEAGRIAEDLWKLIPEKFPYANLDTFVVMPNHMHGIVILEHPVQDVDSQKKSGGGICKDKNPMLSDGLAKAIRWYKARVSFEVRKLIPHFEWQSRFHDHIIRDEQSYQNIRNYIIDNPKRWQADRFHT